jgi:hypothetical protein
MGFGMSRPTGISVFAEGFAEGVAVWTGVLGMDFVHAAHDLGDCPFSRAGSADDKGQFVDGDE